MNVGALGEHLARQYLQEKDYSFVTSNFRTRAGEIDLIFKQGNTYIFVEVKTRLSDRLGKPYEAVGFHKKLRMKRAIDYYLLTNKIGQSPLRVDIVSILLHSNGQISDLKHFENIEID